MDTHLQKTGSIIAMVENLKECIFSATVTGSENIIMFPQSGFELTVFIFFSSTYVDHMDAFKKLGMMSPVPC